MHALTQQAQRNDFSEHNRFDNMADFLERGTFIITLGAHDFQGVMLSSVCVRSLVHYRCN